MTFVILKPLDMVSFHSPAPLPFLVPLLPPPLSLCSACLVLILTSDLEGQHRKRHPSYGGGGGERVGPVRARGKHALRLSTSKAGATPLRSSSPPRPLLLSCSPPSLFSSSPPSCADLLLGG
eukprot:755076-Hanusia_phi.AAC.1